MQNIRTFGVMLGQLMSILNKKQKRQAVGIAFMSMISAMLETLGISVVIPFVLAMLEPESLMENKYVRLIVDALGIEQISQVLLLAAFAIILVYILKNLFILLVLLVNYAQAIFRNRLERDLSIIMLRSYLYKPYLYHINTNSSEIMRGITGDTAGVATIVDAFSTLINEVLTCILIGIVLIWLNPLLAIGLIAIAGITALIMVIGLRKRIGECGRLCRDAFAERYQHAYQAIGGIKDVHVMQRQDAFLDKFILSADKACENNTQYLCMAKMPSRMIEVVFISSLILLVYVCLGVSGNTTSMIAQFGTLAVAAVRILPSISNIANAMNSLVYNRLTLEAACTNINASKKEITMLEDSKRNDGEEKIAHLTKGIEFRKISWKYNKDGSNIIKELSLSIDKGESVALIGESGAGKTTLVDILLGLFRPQSGEILADGKNIFEMPITWAKMIGYVPQTVFLLDDTIRNNILFGVPEEECSEEKIWAALQKAQLKSLVESMPDGLDTILGERGVKISGGQRQRIAIARALYYNPDILVFDEATSALDSDTERAVMESIDALQGIKTLIIVAHRLTTIKKCDKIYEIVNGKAVLKDKAEVFAESE